MGNPQERWEKQWAELDKLPEATVRPCNECPWRRDSRPGHLGPYSAQEWANAAHGESPIACHETIKHEDQDWSELRQCAGMAIFRANIFKSPRHPKVARAKRDEETVFSWDDEFIAHHEGETSED